MTKDKSPLRSELGIIPTWAWVLAALVALAFALGLPIALQDEPAPPPPWLQAILVVVVSTIVAVLILLIGYVNRDTARRGMSRLLWTLIVIVVPNALGFVIYFLMRQPILVPCPRCGLAVRPDFNFCPRCSHRLTTTCPGCGRAVQPGDQFCVQCGTKLQGVQESPVGLEERPPTIDAT